MRNPTIALLGNPNCGKTTLFNALTGLKQHVGNWAGVTVERQSGFFCQDNKQFEVIDLPGTYTLVCPDVETALDERIPSEYLHAHPNGLVLNVIDAVNIERNLYLTLQCLEQKLPMVIALNRMDLAKQQGITLCVKTLAEKLGCPVIPLVARQNVGIDALKSALTVGTTSSRFDKIEYPHAIEQQLIRLAKITDYDRYQWLRWLEGDAPPSSAIANEIAYAQQVILTQTQQAADMLIAHTRYAWIEQLVQDAQQVSVAQTVKQPSSWTEAVDKIVCHRFFGLPVFFGVMYALFFFAINIGGVFQDFFEMMSDTVFVDGQSLLWGSLHAPDWLKVIFVNGLGQGLSTVLTFVPVIGAMFLALSFLEDCGYMARAAFVMDRFMRAVGLPGKSFVPMIIGFGCNVPAIMGTRTLDNKRDRILAVMMSPFMSCGARLAIFTVFVAAFFHTGGQNIVFLLYLIGIGMAVLTGLLLKKTLLKGEVSPLILEMPAYQWPVWRSLWRHSWHRLRRFVINAGKLILPVCAVIGVLNSVNVKGELVSSHQQQNSVLAVIGQQIVPLFKPFGIEEDNWPAAVGLFTGIMAKEVVIGTLNSLYAQQYEESHDFQLFQRLQAATLSIWDNFKALSGAWQNPIAAKAPTTSMNANAYGEMVNRFNGQHNAFAYLLFVLLYFPCISATAAMLREVQKRWTVFSVCWTTGLAYAMAVSYYQCATFMEHPGQSSLWLMIVFAAGCATWWGIRYYSKTYLWKRLPTRIVLTA